MGVIGTAGTRGATRLLLLGSGELGKEVAIEAQRLGVEVIACDHYAGAPAMQVAHRFRVFDMTDGDALRRVVEEERPDLVMPEVESIATSTLQELESEGLRVVPTARAARLTMDREGIRLLAAETLQLKTSPYRFASSELEYRDAVREIGLPCVVKPAMSSSGKGQSVLRTHEDIETGWRRAQVDARGMSGRVIIEGFVDFDYEITLLTVRHVGGTSFCAPVGLRQQDGDYYASWQPQPMSDHALIHAQRMAREVTEALGGYGLFGVEFFVRGDVVWFSEVSPRPHDTGLVTLISQDLSEFALHVRAILGLPIPQIRQLGPSASVVIMGYGHTTSPRFEGLEIALAMPDVQVHLFGKPGVQGKRRLGVVVARDGHLKGAQDRAFQAAEAIRVLVDE
jgi:phosphoribosylglycinamide formyltransferase 2